MSQTEAALADLVRDWYQELEGVRKDLTIARGVSSLGSAAWIRTSKALEVIEKMKGEQDLWLASVE